MIALGLRNASRAAWLVLSLALACSSDPPPAATYRVRAQVVALDGTGEQARVVLDHEAIDGFKDRQGKAERMPSMKMAFGIAPGVDAAAFVVGSKHEITFDAVWGREPMIRVMEAKRLPDATALELGEHH